MLYQDSSKHCRVAENPSVIRISHIFGARSAMIVLFFKLGFQEESVNLFEG